MPHKFAAQDMMPSVRCSYRGAPAVLSAWTHRLMQTRLQMCDCFSGRRLACQRWAHMCHVTSTTYTDPRNSFPKTQMRAYSDNRMLSVSTFGCLLLAHGRFVFCFVCYFSGIRMIIVLRVTCVALGSSDLWDRSPCCSQLKSSAKHGKDKGKACEELRR